MSGKASRGNNASRSCMVSKIVTVACAAVASIALVGHDDNDNGNENTVMVSKVVIAASGAVAAHALVGLLFTLLSSSCSGSKFETTEEEEAYDVDDPWSLQHDDNIPSSQTGWTKPELGWVKLNVDASKDHIGRPSASYGGVLRDESGSLQHHDNIPSSQIGWTKLESGWVKLNVDGSKDHIGRPSADDVDDPWSLQHHDNIPSSQIGWAKSESGWVKLNVGGWKDHKGRPSAGCGGVLRDESGEWLKGFAQKRRRRRRRRKALLRREEEEEVDDVDDPWSLQHHNNIPSSQIGWTEPESGWVKLNVDGSKDHIGYPSVGCGGVLRDESGEWLKGFAKKRRRKRKRRKALLRKEEEADDVDDPWSLQHHDNIPSSKKKKKKKKKNFAQKRRRRKTVLKEEEEEADVVDEEADNVDDPWSLQHHDNIPSSPIGWTKPESGWVKLNVDGSKVHKGRPSAGCGGVLRDESGEWLKGFAQKLDPSCKVHETELPAILKGMELAREMNVEKLVVESDFVCAVSMVENDCKFNHPQFDLISCIRQLRFDPKWQVKVFHIPREANGVADRLAKDARDLSTDGLRKYPHPPRNCSRLVLEDAQGVSYY